MPSVKSVRKTKNPYLNNGATMYADDVAPQKPELVKNAKIVSIVNAVLCLLALLVPFIPVHFDKKLVTEPTMPNLIGVIGRDLGVEINRQDGAGLLILFLVAAVFIAVGLICSYYVDRLAGLFSFAGCIMLACFGIAWLSQAQDMPKGVTETLASALSKTPIPVLLLLFSIGGAITSMLAFLGYKVKRSGRGA